MKELLAFWTPIVRAFDPYQPIAIGDPQHYYVKRPKDPISQPLPPNLFLPKPAIGLLEGASSQERQAGCGRL